MMTETTGHDHRNTQQGSSKPEIYFGVPVGSFAIKSSGTAVVTQECMGKLSDGEWSFAPVSPPYRIIHRDWLYSGGSNLLHGPEPVMLTNIDTGQEIALSSNYTDATVTDNGHIIALGQEGRSAQQIFVHSPEGKLLKAIQCPPDIKTANTNIEAVSASSVAIITHNRLDLLDIEQGTFQPVVTSKLQLFQYPIRAASGVLIFCVFYSLGNPDDIPLDLRMGVFRLIESETPGKKASSSQGR